MLSKVLSNPLTSVDWKKMTPHLILCLLAYIGLLNKLKKAYFPYYTRLSFPRVILGAVICFACIFYMFLLKSIPNSFNEFKWSLSLSSLMRSIIYFSFSRASKMVFSDTFFLLISSKFYGMPVIKHNYGISKIYWVPFLFYAFKSGCLGFLIVILYFSS